MSELEDLRAKVIALAGEVEAYRGALGYAVPGDCDGRLSDGTFPNNGIAEAVCKERDALRAEVAAWSEEALAWRNQCTGAHGSHKACVNVAALADKQEAP